MLRSCAKMELHREKDWREKVVAQLVEVLSAYRLNVGSLTAGVLTDLLFSLFLSVRGTTPPMRRALSVQCASASSEGQLILPDSLKLLPVYTQALFKHAVTKSFGREQKRWWLRSPENFCGLYVWRLQAFRQSSVDPQHRVYSLLRFMQVSIAEFANHLYPRLCVLHKSFTVPPALRKALLRVGKERRFLNSFFSDPKMPFERAAMFAGWGVDWRRRNRLECSGSGCQRLSNIERRRLPLRYGGVFASLHRQTRQAAVPSGGKKLRLPSRKAFVCVRCCEGWSSSLSLLPPSSSSRASLLFSVCNASCAAFRRRGRLTLGPSERRHSAPARRSRQRGR